jgi:hypothetical protein
MPNPSSQGDKRNGMAQFVAKLGITKFYPTVSFKDANGTKHGPFLCEVDLQPLLANDGIDSRATLTIMPRV